MPPPLQIPSPQRPSRREAPRLAFVLGSGGVRSMGALGAQSVFEQHGLQPDLVVGCSSGALFGATIAMGLPADEGARLCASIWSPEVTERRNWRAYAQLLAPKLAGFGADFALRDVRTLHARIAAAAAGRRIELLPIALRIAATDVASGAPVVISRGDLGTALCASIAVPLLFPSVEFEGRRLADGVLSDPLPVAAALDARVIVTQGMQGHMPRRVDRASRLAAQATTALINNLQQARLDAARGQARLIELQLEMPRRVGLWDPSALPEAFEAGRRAALAALPALRAALQAADVPHRDPAASAEAA